MVERRIHFLSGLPRTGSTLLGSILNQHPHVYVSPTSPVYPFLVGVNETCNELHVQYTFDIEKTHHIYREIVKAFYPDDRKKPVVFDKHRGWPKRVPAIKEFVDPFPRIVCTVRPIAEIVTSYIVLADKDPDNFIDAHLKRENRPLNNESRALLLWEQYLKVPYENMLYGMANHPENMLLLEYDELVNNPALALARIASFCGMERFEYRFDRIENTCAEAKDDAWGLKRLHEIRPKLKRISVSPINVLPRVAIEYFSQFDLRGAC